MTEGSRLANAESLAPVVRSVFGWDRFVVRVERMAGGSKKGVYRVTLDDGGSAVVYVWDESEDYWHDVLSEGAEDPADPFSHASGLALFEAAARRLSAAGARCPDVRLTDGSRTVFPADIAVVEDVPGGSLEALLERDAVAAERPLAMVGDWLRAMAAVRGPSFGKVAFVDAGGRAASPSCQRAVLDHALAQVSEIAAHDQRMAAERSDLEDRLNRLAEPIEPRGDWALVHGELGADHVRLDAGGEPVLIDLEGARYFDVEIEHVWTRMRFGDHYGSLGRFDLDEDRLRFYQVCMHLDLVAGPLRMAATDHPQRQWFADLAEHHLHHALGYR
ncbi:MAG TPA: hypothetical protein VKV06_04850 [Acidimicrobiales bacterium]|nr:hypothetical protein [Acidimicrobiales bacterium]